MFSIIALCWLQVSGFKFIKCKNKALFFFWRCTCAHTLVCLVCVTSSSPCCSFQVCIYESPGSTENQIFFNIYLNVTLTAVSVSMYSCVRVCVHARVHGAKSVIITSPRPPCTCERTNKVNQSHSHLFTPPAQTSPVNTLWSLDVHKCGVFFLRADTITFTSHLILNLTPLQKNLSFTK